MHQQDITTPARGASEHSLYQCLGALDHWVFGSFFMREFYFFLSAPTPPQPIEFDCKLSDYGLWLWRGNFSNFSVSQLSVKYKEHNYSVKCQVIYISASAMPPCQRLSHGYILWDTNATFGSWMMWARNFYTTLLIHGYEFVPKRVLSSMVLLPWI